MNGKGPQQDWKQPLVWVVAAIFGVGTIVAVAVAEARGPSYALGSELVYRVEIGAVAVGSCCSCSRHCGSLRSAARSPPSAPVR